MNIILWILVQCDTNTDLKLIHVNRSVTYISRSNFALYLYDYLAILNYLPFSDHSGLLQFHMKVFVNIVVFPPACFSMVLRHALLFWPCPFSVVLFCSVKKS